MENPYENKRSGKLLRIHKFLLIKNFSHMTKPLNELKGKKE